MFKKRYIAILFLIIFIFSISHVVAAENLNNLTQDDSSKTLKQDDEILIGENGYGTYSQLEDLIVNNHEIELDRDYILEESDSRYNVSGIGISHEMTLDGKGHTIYTNMSRVFYVNIGVSDVKIHNLNIKNVYYPNADEYYSPGLDYAGAIFNDGELYLENCTFTDCHSNAQGGAIFNNNTLTTDNCTFLRNSIYKNYYGGGAIWSAGKLAIISSKFYDNYGRFGGAVLSFNRTTILNSYFENNFASISGGAIFNMLPDICEVYNSSFHDNKAQYGGALFSVIAVNCSFVNNSAVTKQGNNANGGAILNCTSDRNAPEDFYSTPNSTGFYFNPGRLNFEMGGFDKSLEFYTFSNPSNEKVSGVGLNIVITDKFNQTRNYSLGSDEYGVVGIPLSDFANGTYKVRVSFSNKLFNCDEKEYTLYLGILNSTVSFSAGVAFEYGGSGSIFVIVDGGIVEEKNIRVLGQPKAKITLVNKLITISGLDVGTYTLQVETTPDENHFATVGTVPINVKKAVAVIKASKLTVALKKGTLWSVYLVDSKTNKVIANMQLTLKVYTGKKYKIVKVTTNANGVASFKTSGLSKGNHKVIVSGSHPGFSFNTVTSSIKVIKPKELTFKVQKRVNDNDGALISYVVKDKKTNKGINGVKINLLIYTGKKYKVISLKTKKSGKYNGAMGFSTNDLSVGKHKVLVIPANIKYSGSAKTTMIIKKAAKKKQTYSHKL
ncbi:hypothetical protein [Methanobrevibacter sp.]|uniref:hypothetical protein n=1 Tax=Methanobrevibacter sp. TaxID=66852 RepID=UPI00386E53F2